MGYLDGRGTADLHLDNKCGKGWEGTKGKCVRVKAKGDPKKQSDGNTKKAPSNLLAQGAAILRTPQGRLGVLALGAGAFVGADALYRQGAVMGVTPEKVETVDAEEMGIGRGREVGRGVSGVAELVRDKEGNQYIKKSAHPTKKRMTQEEQMGRAMYVYSSSLESTVSDIGAKAGIPVPKVSMIPAKDGDQLGSTVQELAKGSTVYSQMLKGEIPPTFNAQIGSVTAMGYIPTGLSSENLKAIGSNPDIAKIMALDTFTGNRDRHANNLFYDKETDSYTGIDNGLAFEHPMITKSVADSLLTNKAAFTRQVWSDKKIKQGMQTYRDTLAKLIRDNPPKKTKGKLLGYMQHETGLNIINDFYTKTDKNLSVDSNYKEAQRAVALLDEILREPRAAR